MTTAFIDRSQRMHRRNLAAVFLATTINAAGPQVSLTSPWTWDGAQPTLDSTAFTLDQAPAPLRLTLTAFAPSISTARNNLPSAGVGYHHIDRRSTQAKVNNYRNWLVSVGLPSPGPTIAIPPGVLQLQSFAPQILQATPILVGQDTQSNYEFAEVWQPDRRNYYALSLNPPGNTLNINLAQLSLAGFAPDISVTGTVQPPAAGLSLSAFAPSISQQNSGLVSVPLAQLTLNGFAPDILVSGSLLIPQLGLTLTAPAPVITQGTVPGAANLPTGPYISGVGPWDITVKDYG